jgi:hypothetical protein
MRPPGVEEDWNECDVWTQAHIIGYGQVRDTEELEQEIELIKAQYPKK